MDGDRAILVIGPGWVGDMVMAQCLFQALKKADPAVAIDVMAPRWSAALLARMPEVRGWLDAPFARRRLGLLARFRSGAALRGRYEAAYVLPGSWKSALVPLFAGIARRVGYTREGRFGLLNDRPALPGALKRRTAAMFARLAGVEPCGVPKLAVDGANQATLLARHDLRGAFVAFMPGAEYGPAKRWPASRYASLARRLQARGLGVVLLGSAADAPVGADIAMLAPGAVDLCGQTRLEDAVDLLAAARLAVSNDSGLMHIAAAVGTPIVALYGSTSPDDTPPLTAAAALLTLRLPCSPCHDRQCRFGHTNCLALLDAPQVERAVERLIGSPA